MKQLIRRLSRVADSSHYCLLRSDSSARPAGRSESFRAKLRRRPAAAEEAVPSGHVPVYVGEEAEAAERFVVSAEVLNHPVFVELLEKYSAQEYGYDQKGVLRIPCHVILFERVLQALRLGLLPHSRDLRDLLGGVVSS
uniref:Small auxin up regulated protein n=1 Tax=Boehmeria nivea TaxID=83906 RepID=A0A172J1Y4_BOENI|nr:small auxin up regulated protein [Boehmeria nivea]